MLRTHGVLTLFLVCLFLVSPVPAQDDSDSSLTLKVLEVLPTSHGTGWNVLFQNSADEAVTALAVQIETYFDDGTDVKAIQTLDFASTEDYLLPGAQSEKVVQSVEKEEANAIEVVIKPVMVLFNDLSFEGDATLAEQILLSREAAQLARVHWLLSFRELLAQGLNDDQLADEVSQMIHRLENHTDRRSNRRISTNHHSARLKESSIARQLQQLLEGSFGTPIGLREGLQALVVSLESELARLSKAVTHNLEATPLRTPLRR